MTKQKKDGLRVLVTALIVILLALSAAGGYLIGSSKIVTVLNNKKSECIKEVNRVVEEVKEERQNDNSTEGTTVAENKCDSCAKTRICEGVFKGEVAVLTDARTKEKTFGEMKLQLNQDGTFEESTQYNKESGKYMIIDNTLLLYTLPHTTGPDRAEMSLFRALTINNECTIVSGMIFDSPAQLTK
ncbi:MAG: hypothetical protein IJI22_01030 [Bacilli bacterium]|nr:hypothetical protein [Bacilli bacterium]